MGREELCLHYWLSYRIMHDNYAFLHKFARVSPQEGRVLIMTTNHIEHLEEEIIRLGLG